MMITKKQIDQFFQTSTIAIAGVSRNPDKFGHNLMNELQTRGFNIIPINPNTSSILGKDCYSSVDALPEGINHLIICVNKEYCRETIEQALNRHIQNIWIQQMSETPEAIELARSKNINLIYGKCIFMFAEPVRGIHKFHRGILKLFGNYPR